MLVKNNLDVDEPEIPLHFWRIYIYLWHRSLSQLKFDSCWLRCTL